MECWQQVDRLKLSDCSKHTAEAFSHGSTKGRPYYGIPRRSDVYLSLQDLLHANLYNKASEMADLQ